MSKKLIILLACIGMLLMGFSGFSQDNGKYTFAVIPGGVHPFYGPFPQAIADAAKDLGIPVPTMQSPQLFNQNDQNTIIDAILSKGVKGIAMQPADPVGGNEKITEIVKMGIPVVGFAGPPKSPTDMTFCLATDVGLAAYTGTKNLIKEMGGKGNIVHLAGMLAELNTKMRMDGVQKAVDESPGVKLIQTITDIDVAEPAQNAVNSLMAAKRDQIDGIVSTGYIQSVTLASIFTQLKERRIKTVGTDTDDSVIQAIKDGYMTGTMSQNPYGQAYLCVTALKMFADGYKFKPSSPFFINSGFFYINKGNVTKASDLAKQATADLKKKFQDYFTK